MPAMSSDLAGAVVDLGQLDQGHVVVEFLVEALAVDRLHRHRSPGALAHRLDDVDVGVEVRRVGQHDVSIGTLLERRADQLGDQEGQRVRDQDLAGLGPDQWREAVPEPRRLGHPARVVPAPHEPSAPLDVEDLVARAVEPTPIPARVSCRRGRSRPR
jgi:hypothetical protein